MEPTLPLTACTPLALVWRPPAGSHPLRCARSVVAALVAQGRQAGCLIHAYTVLPRRIEVVASVPVAGGVATLQRVLSVAGVDAGHWAPARSVLSAEALWAWHRRIDQAAVRAGRVDTADAYRWASHAALGHGDPDRVLAPHPAYLALGPTRETRQAAYRARVDAAATRMQSTGGVAGAVHAGRATPVDHAARAATARHPRATS